MVMHKKITRCRSLWRFPAVKVLTGLTMQRRLKVSLLINLLIILGLLTLILIISRPANWRGHVKLVNSVMWAGDTMGETNSRHDLFILNGSQPIGASTAYRSSLMPAHASKSLTDIVHFPSHHVGLCFQGRTGNLMFEYASLYGIAKKNNLIPTITPSLAIVSVFNLTAKEVAKDSELKYSRKYTEKNGCMFEAEVMKLGSGSDVLLNGYFQSWKYFRHVEADLRQQFAFDFKIQDTAFKQLSLLTKDRPISDYSVIGVHVRKGDMVHKKSYVDYGYVTADVSYLNSAMNYFRRKFPKSVFIIASDEVDWCKKNLNDSDIRIIETNNTPLEDMAILAQCNHTIMTVGSFGWWSAWLAGGEVVYYKEYPTPGSKLFELFNKEDYFYPGWIGM